MSNTAIYYKYTDADNYKCGKSAIVRGEITAVQKRAILESLCDGEFFIPSAVGLPHGLPKGGFSAFNPGVDHPFFSMDADAFSLTDEAPTVDTSIGDVAAKFTANKMKWAELGVSIQCANLGWGPSVAEIFPNPDRASAENVLAIVDTPLGQLLVSKAVDLEHPGVHIDLRRADAGVDAPVAMVEYSETETASREGRLITRVWDDVSEENCTIKVVHTGIDEFFA